MYSENVMAVLALGGFVLTIVTLSFATLGIVKLYRKLKHTLPAKE